MISITTPVHKASQQFLIDTFQSIKEQTFSDWEWIIVPNNGGCVPDEIIKDPRVKIFPIEDDDPKKKHNLIGRLKNFACKQATGDILVELDADDLLTPNALHEVYLAFKDPLIAMTYSNSAQFQDKTWESTAYSNYYGWETRPFQYKNHELIEMIAWKPSPAMMRFIFWAPNHIRAWKTSAYNSIGGHDKTMKTGDDHDLCCRFYIKYGDRGIKHIDKCLYIYRLHDKNSCVVNNLEVQDQTLKNYLNYSRDIIVKWANDNNLKKIDLGGKFNAFKDFETVDLIDADIITDLNKTWPFEDSSIGIIRASHIFEHLKAPIHTMNEAFRCLAPGGWLLIDVPSTDGRGAFQDPTHISFWNENSIWYYTDRNYSKYIPEYKGRFQNSRTITYFPSKFNEEHNIPIVQSDLIAIKDDYSKRHVGAILI